MGIVVAVVLGLGGVLSYARITGLRARSAPPAAEAVVARTVRSWAIPPADRVRTAPVTAEAPLDDALAHYADHCAVCHGVDGRGDTAMGRGLYPPAPDMTSAATQALTDGELFWVIENGVRFTGMPAWATGTADGEASSWALVKVIRRLPRLSAEERLRIESVVPRSPDEVRQAIEEEQFLQGGSGR